MEHNKKQVHAERFMPWFIICGFSLYLLGGIFGGMVFEPKSTGQMISWQIGNTGAICGAVLAGALLSKQDWHIPSAGFIILGIVHSVFFASLIMDTIDERIFATGAIIFIPAIFLINFYPVFPLWVKISGWLSCILFLVMYIRMLTGDFVYQDWSQLTSYMVEEFTIIMWCVYFRKAFIQDTASRQA